MNNEQKQQKITIRLALACGECGADMHRVDATEEEVIYRCVGYGHEFRQPRKALRYRSTGRNETPKDAA